MVTSLFIFVVSLLMVIRGAMLSTKHAGRLAESLNLSKYAVGFIVIAVISILPETFISLNAALTGIPAFGLGMLLGSNVADLTLIFALIAFLAGRGLKVEQKILKGQVLFPLLLLFPIILGLDGSFSRLEGLLLCVAGGVFYYLALRGERREKLPIKKKGNRQHNFLWLLFSLAIMLIGAHFTVTSASSIAAAFGISPVIIGMLIVGLGTTMPEFFFSLWAIKQREDSLAIGDLLGTVIADATVVIGLIALISPFTFPLTTIYIGGVFMVAVALILFSFMRSGRIVTRKEAYALFIFWITFVLVEFIVSAGTH